MNLTLEGTRLPGMALLEKSSSNRVEEINIGN
jgi:hypothetical protein